MLSKILQNSQTQSQRISIKLDMKTRTTSGMDKGQRRPTKREENEPQALTGCDWPCSRSWPTRVAGIRLHCLDKSMQTKYFYISISTSLVGWWNLQNSYGAQYEAKSHFKISTFFTLAPHVEICAEYSHASFSALYFGTNISLLYC